MITQFMAQFWKLINFTALTVSMFTLIKTLLMLNKLHGYDKKKSSHDM